MASTATENPPTQDCPDLTHRDLRDDEFWREIPGYATVSREIFTDYRWQQQNTISNPHQLGEVLGAMAPRSFLQDVCDAAPYATMSLKLTPYVVSLVDWSHPYRDPLRLQFVSVRSQMVEDHPMLQFDPLSEEDHSPMSGVVRRYVDRALLVTNNTCPTYCRFCTRSYSVGKSTPALEKVVFRAGSKHWSAVLEYIASHPEIEDVLVSGGDCCCLSPGQIRQLGETLLSCENVRRLRFATRGPAVMPQLLLTHNDWLDALTEVVELGRKRGRSVVVHTHFNHPNEITAMSRDALARCFRRGIIVRNQSVLLSGVNDTVEVMSLLIKRLGFINVQPVYVHLHDQVKGVEDLRTTLQTGITLEKNLRGVTAGFHTPTFVVDPPNGCGKRDIHSYETYDRETGVSVFTSPAMHPNTYFTYFDPLGRLGKGAQARWADPSQRELMLHRVLKMARTQHEST